MNRLFASDLRNGVKTSRMTIVKKGVMIKSVIRKAKNESKFGIKSKIKRILFCIKLRKLGFSNLSTVLKTNSEKNCSRTMVKTRDSEGTILRKVSFIILLNAILPRLKRNAPFGI